LRAEVFSFYGFSQKLQNKNPAAKKSAAG
jgi:hypothetical protein